MTFHPGDLVTYDDYDDLVDRYVVDSQTYIARDQYFDDDWEDFRIKDHTTHINLMTDIFREPRRVSKEGATEGSDHIFREPIGPLRDSRA